SHYFHRFHRAAVPPNQTRSAEINRRDAKGAEKEKRGATSLVQPSSPLRGFLAMCPRNGKAELPSPAVPPHKNWNYLTALAVTCQPPVLGTHYGWRSDSDLRTPRRCERSYAPKFILCPFGYEV